MMKPEVLERRCREMREKNADQNQTKVQLVESKPGEFEPVVTVAEAAVRLGVSNSTARRLLKNDARRYRTGLEGPMYPGDRLKRGQRVRMSWVIPESAVQRVILRMRGLAA